jgi:hypothetical protein
MEHIVYLHLRWKLQPVGAAADPLNYLVGPEVFRRQLGQRPVANGHGDVLVQAEPRPLADLKLELTVLLVMRELHDPLCLKKLIAHLHKKDAPIAELLIHHRHPRRTRKQGRWRLTIDDFERRRLQRCLVRSIIAIFRPWKPPQAALGSITG